jgi:prepilin-type N-terminal cleavage/methylation domain-containing protein
MARWRDRRAEGGFTMVELVMAVAILGILSTTIGVVGIVMFRTMGETQDRLEETRGPRFASVYWIPDVASAETVNPSGVVCGSGGTTLVTLRWDDFQTGDTRVTYATTTTATGKTQLVRRLCASGSTTPTRTTVVAPSVAATGGAVITCGNGTTYSACSTPDTDKSLLLSVKPRGGGNPYEIDAYREVT